MRSTFANPFDFNTVASRYDSGRPYFHTVVIDKIRTHLGITKRLNRALDVGCGTGLSSRALLAIASYVDAIDASKEMLDRAFRDPQIHYRNQRAEDIDHPNGSFEIVTVSQVIHWTNQTSLFANTSRCLKQNGHLVVYDNFFLWKSDSCEDFAGWFNEEFLVKFPKPRRGEIALRNDGSGVPREFAFAGYEEYTSPIVYTCDQLVNYLITQSNVCVACDAQGISIDVAKDWLFEQTERFFQESETRSFQFGGPIYYLRKDGRC